MKKMVLYLACLGGLVSMAAGAWAQDKSLFTADQAKAGAVVYQKSCAECHGAALEGVEAPALKGSGFREMAAAQSLHADALLNTVSQTMPQSDPGSLSADDYNNVVAYMLEQNGFAPGLTPLSPSNQNLKDATVAK